MATYVKLKVFVHCAARTLVHATFVSLEPVSNGRIPTGEFQPLRRRPHVRLSLRRH